MKTKGKTTIEIMRRLESDPEWVARRDEQDRRAREIDKKFRVIERPITKDLESIGFNVERDGVWHFVNTSERYDTALPVLLKHLQRDYPDVVREGLARSLGRPWTRDMAWDHVLAAYLAEPNKDDVAPPGQIGSPSGPKDGMAVALSAMVRPADLDILIELISDPNNGPSRIFFVRNLSRSKSPKAFAALTRLSKDPMLRAVVEFRLKSKLRRQAKKAGAQSARQ